MKILPGKWVQEQGYYDGGKYDASKVYGTNLEYFRVWRPFQVVDGVVSHHAKI